MTQETEVLKPEPTTAGQTTDERPRQVLSPAMDVAEQPEAVVITLDLPGVEPAGLDVNVENGVLTVEGRARVEGPAGYTGLRAEFDAVVFRRTLRLPDGLQAVASAAHVKQGVLRLTIPKREDVKPRRIQIKAG